MNIIELENISKIYSGRDYEVLAVDNLSLSVRKGEMIAIMGASGSGKTTLMNILSLIESMDGGKYYLDGKNVSHLTDRELAYYRNRKLGFVLQDFALIERYTALENVMVPLQYSDYSRKQWKQIALDVLQEMGMRDKKDRFPEELSVGQKQRIAIARALVNGADIILADEPTGSLDSQTSEEIMRIFRRLNQFGATVIIVTHDENVANQCSRVLKLEDGRILSEEN